MIKTKVLLHQHLLFFCLLFLCQLETTVKQTWLLMLKTNFTLILFKPSESQFATQPFLVSSRNAPPGALRDDTKNGCVADYRKAR